MAVKVNTNDLMEILKKTPDSQNIMLMGKHGIGKSQILTDYFSTQGCKVVTLFLGQMSDPGDLIGLLHKNEKTGKTEFMPPYWFPTDDQSVVLFLDELNRARPEVLQTIMDLALNRTLAGKSLPKGSRIISAVNSGDEYQLTDLDPALVSRFNIYEFCPTVREWLMWAQKKSIDKRIIDFISQDEKFLDGDGKEIMDGSMEKTSDRRAWERVSDIISNLETEELNDTYKKIVAGIVGAKAAAKFFESIKNFRIISPESLLSDDFETLKKNLSLYRTMEFAILNDGIFRSLETAKFTEKKSKTAAKNLESYFDFLEEKNEREAMAHFANMFGGTNYPNSLMFIIDWSPDLYKKITKFIAEIK